MKEFDENYIAFEGATLEEAYKKASLEFHCSITDLRSEIIQAPSNGFLGFFKKNAIIKVFRAKSSRVDQSPHKAEEVVTEFKLKKEEIKIQDISLRVEELHAQTSYIRNDSLDEPKLVIQKKEENKIFEAFYDNPSAPTQEIHHIKSQKVLEEIREKINQLLSYLPYEMNPVVISYYDDKTLYIEFTGKDSALLIGKEGYRYKALSYILFNWIHEHYNLMIRLEIAEFLQTQEESIAKYLEPVIEIIKKEGFYKTKTLDGILIHIALTKLREEFPLKYIAVKSNIKGEKYIVINEYRK